MEFYERTREDEIEFGRFTEKVDNVYNKLRPFEEEIDLFDISSAPDFICNCFEDVFGTQDTEKRVYITIGLFSIIKLERSVQLLIPVYDFCIPSKECVSSTSENPCELFESLDFPVDEFYPPVNGNDSGCGCGCN